jgi:hypothetical protein
MRIEIGAERSSNAFSRSYWGVTRRVVPANSMANMPPIHGSRKDAAKVASGLPGPHVRVPALDPAQCRA